MHWCSQQRGTPGIPLERYGPVDLMREYRSTKSCVPGCTISCVHRVALLDDLREHPVETLDRLTTAHEAAGRRPPATVKLLSWMFVRSPRRETFRRLAGRALGVTR